MPFPSRLEPHREFITKARADGHTIADIARTLEVPYSTLRAFIESMDCDRVADHRDPDQLRETLERIASA